MTETFPILFAVVLVILTVVLVAVGVQLFLVLKSFRQALEKVNSALDETEEKIKAITEPLQNLAGIAAGVKTGVKVFEGFSQFLNRKKTESPEDIVEE
jgi:lipopolysaccharide export LptBFGC system permease protein LptF